jgi:hypothetical protein
MCPKAQTTHISGSADDSLAACTVGTHKTCPSSPPTTSTSAPSGLSPHSDGSFVQCACGPPAHSTRPSILSEPRTSKREPGRKRSACVLHRRGRADRRSIRCAEAARISAAYFWTETGTHFHPCAPDQRETEARKGSPQRSMRSSISSRFRTRPLRAMTRCIHAPSDTELDLAAERASALDLLSAMFGEANTDWGDAKSIDSDVEMAGVYASKPRAPSDLLESTDFEDGLAAHEPHTSQREERSLLLTGKQRLLLHLQRPIMPVIYVDKYRAQVAALMDLGTMDPQIRYL